MIADTWDYLILTAAHEQQAAAYRRQLDIRCGLGLLRGVRQALVVADPDGRRVGSGGSTVQCLLTVLNRELAGHGDVGSAESWANVLCGLRILIIHAGGDSRRLPAYAPCGKIFIPVPVPSNAALENSLFDLQWPVYRRLPPSDRGMGQVVICAGDVLLDFNPGEIDFRSSGVVGLACKASPLQASRHGVYCLGPAGQVRRFLQKPSLIEQREHGAIDGYGQSALDIGVFHFDGSVAVKLLQVCGSQVDGNGQLAWSGPVAEAILRHGLDFYREIACALGGDSTLAAYRAALRASGSGWEDMLIGMLFDAIAATPCQAQVLKECSFLHFGTTQEIIHSGRALRHRAGRVALDHACVDITNLLAADGATIPAATAWVEGCVLAAPLELAGENLLVGADVRESLRLPLHGCLDVVSGYNRHGKPVTFIRCYHDSDHFQEQSEDGTSLCGYPLASWLKAAGAQPEDVWDQALPADRRSTWNARLFPAESGPAGYHRWVWMLTPASATAEQFEAWRQADRYSLAEMSSLVDQRQFHVRRAQIREAQILGSLRRQFLPESDFSAADLASLLSETNHPEAWIAAVLTEARWHWQRRGTEAEEEAFVCSRILHSLGTALLRASSDTAPSISTGLAVLLRILEPADTEWLKVAGLMPGSQVSLSQWASGLQAAAFAYLRSRIASTGSAVSERPVNTLRSDEIVWGRAPARLDLAGGWTDTPPYALEHGGQVLNAAVQINDQPPIHVYARVIPELLIRCRSIDRGTQEEIHCWDNLVDDVKATGEFSLAKAALTISGFASGCDGASSAGSLAEMLKDFGGGLELTTMAALPKGSGLGTSSIMGAVLLATIHRVLGRHLSQNELFHAVMRLEQIMTTGGGWQDQVGGAIGGLKLATTQPGLIPAPTLRYVPTDVLDPAHNGGQTLLLYTGITRLAKNILQQVVGRWLDRDREAVETLESIGLLARDMTEAVASRDLPEFGRLIDVAWQLNKRLDPNSTTEEIEVLLDGLRPHIHGAKLLGAGGGGFLFLVCKTSADAARVRDLIEARPPNPRARFFDFDLSGQGLAVSAC